MLDIIIRMYKEELINLLVEEIRVDDLIKYIESKKVVLSNG